MRIFHGRMASVGFGSAVLFLATSLAYIAALEAGEPAQSPAVSRAQIEADWLLQDEVRALPAIPEAVRRGWSAGVTKQQDAAGGCDGIIDGTFGFHTGLRRTALVASRSRPEPPLG